jgi:hypothetical protein
VMPASLLVLSFVGERDFMRYENFRFRPVTVIRGCKHSPKILLIYRLCLLFTIGSIVGFSLAIINRLGI